MRYCDEIGPIPAGWGCYSLCQYGRLDIYESDPEVWDCDTEEVYPIVMVRPASVADFLVHATGRHKPRLALGNEQDFQTLQKRFELEFIEHMGRVQLAEAGERMTFSGLRSLAGMVIDPKKHRVPLEPIDLGARNVGELLRIFWGR